jgi:hypothetical protein
MSNGLEKYLSDTLDANSMGLSKYYCPVCKRNLPVRWHYVPNFVNIDTIGVIYEPAPDPVPEGYVPVAKDGWHVNARVVGSEDITALEPYSILSEHPHRVWG